MIKGESYIAKFVKPIIEMSKADNWEDARKEWELVRIWEQEDGECLCGHYIKDHCEIVNTNTEHTVIVGNCCITKFDEKLDNRKEFASIKRVKDDPKKSSLKPKIIHQCCDRGVINEWQKDFYLSIARKRKLTEKQEFQKIKINRIILEYIGGKRK